jgi:hypothetical protein
MFNLLHGFRQSPVNNLGWHISTLEVLAIRLAYITNT